MQIINFCIELVCQNCFNHYVLGLTGDVNGCDVCEGNERNSVDHSIIGKTPLVELEKV